MLTTVMGLAMALLTPSRMRGRESVPIEGMTPLQVIPRTTAVACAMLPTKNEDGQLSFDFDAPPAAVNEADGAVSSVEQAA